MSDPLEEFMRPEFPKVEFNEKAVVTRIEYIGTTSTIESSLVEVGEPWGDYPGELKSATIEPTDDPEISVAMVTVEQIIDNEDAGEGTLVGVSYEIRWLTVERSMFEHPSFAIGGNGPNALSEFDIYCIEKWRAPENTRELYEEYKIDDDGYELELNSNAKLFARGIQLGLETFEDKAPIAVKISDYVKGPPPATDAGLKETGVPPGFPNLPDGFEWRKESADAVRAAGQTRWTLTEEWLGAKKILFDRENIYWTL
jgi:hypothetical protein